MAEAHHAIKAVVKRTGLSAHVIRIWEKRYQAVTPERTQTNRRLYSEEQIERLSLLRDLTHAGHSIAQVANLPMDKLRKFVAEGGGGATNGHVRWEGLPTPDARFLEESVAAVKKLDARALEETLKRASAEFGGQGLLQRVIAPLAQRIGALWRDGIITAAHEHFASAVLRIILGHAAKQFGGGENAPVIVVATPTGQLHELGALLAAAAAANIGWRVTYLGASLPAAEIGGAVRQNQARAVALSIVYPEDDPRLEGELSRLKELLPPGVSLLAGGRAAPAYREALEKAGAVLCQDLAELSAALDGLRRSGK